MSVVLLRGQILSWEMPFRGVAIAVLPELILLPWIEYELRKRPQEKHLLACIRSVDLIAIILFGVVACSNHDASGAMKMLHSERYHWSMNKILEP